MQISDCFDIIYFSCRANASNLIKNNNLLKYRINNTSSSDEGGQEVLKTR